MKPVLYLVLLTVLFSTLPAAAKEADQREYAACNFCGMDLGKFPTGRMLLAYQDKSTVATCSLHCTVCALSLSFNDLPTTIKASDYNSRQLIDAKKAIWVLGGEKPGVMTAEAKWAFNSQTTAEQFVSSYGGRIIDFEQALQAASADRSNNALRLHNRCEHEKPKI